MNNISFINTAHDSNQIERAAKVGDKNCCCNNDSKQSVCN